MNTAKLLPAAAKRRLSQPPKNNNFPVVQNPDPWNGQAHIPEMDRPGHYMPGMEPIPVVPAPTNPRPIFPHLTPQQSEINTGNAAFRQDNADINRMKTLPNVYSNDVVRARELDAMALKKHIADLIMQSRQQQGPHLLGG